ncbi:MAG: hypothetical protein AAF366_02615 [Pseudomonadota bacterium]
MVEQTTYLAAPPDRVWQEVQRPALLRFVAAPLIRFRAVDPSVWPDIWPEGPHVVSMWLLGGLPLGRQVIDISRPATSGSERVLRDNGHSASIRRWDHHLVVAPEGEGTLYTDRVEIDARWRTPVVAAFAKSFYAHRQRRWQALVAADFDYDAA